MTTPDHDDFRIVALALKVDILQHQLKTLENSGQSSQENKNDVGKYNVIINSLTK